MPRVKLTDEERAARIKARTVYSFSDAAYKHYDESEGFGSADEWIRIAEALLGGGAKLVFSKEDKNSKDLAYLNLFEMPATPELLKKAFRNSLFIYHPDHGGSNEAVREAMAAFERLSKHYR
jgi:hypothetical protein